uniref:Uncharacterized protein n=1 Tax=Romanomermis culicivorax TaxID=13658 RepID=A0A915I7J6_ROMCU
MGDRQAQVWVTTVALDPRPRQGVVLIVPVDDFSALKPMRQRCTSFSCKPKKIDCEDFSNSNLLPRAETNDANISNPENKSTNNGFTSPKSSKRKVRPSTDKTSKKRKLGSSEKTPHNN